ncbi:hypothetical protein [Thalassotalea fusca]
MWVKWFVIAFLLLIPTDHYSLSEYLAHVVTQGSASSQELKLAQTYSPKTYHRYQYQNAQKGSRDWLDAAVYLAQSSARYAIALGQFFEAQHEQKLADKWYLHALGLNDLDTKGKEAVAAYLYAQGRYEQIEQVVSSSEQSTVLLDYLIDAHLALGNINKIRDILQAREQTQWSKDTMATLNKFQVFKPILIDSQQCETSIQLFATNKEDLRRAEQLIKLIEQKAVGRYFCFEQVKYIALSKLNCQLDATKAIQCDEHIWKDNVQGIAARYIGVLLPEGGANVHEGIFYIDRKDSVDVFAHEIWHLLGFVDEYPLPIGHVDCQTQQLTAIAPNVVVTPTVLFEDRQSAREMLLKAVPWADKIAPTTPILERIDNMWQIGTPASYANEIGLFPSNTCDNSTMHAFKAVGYFTSLEYQEMTVPSLYHQLATTSANEFVHPSYHFNIALANERRGYTALAREWLLKTQFGISNHHSLQQNSE